MNWDRIEGNWKQFSGKVQQQWGKLTNDDLSKVEGKRTELVGRIQERYGYAKDQAEREVDDWVNGILADFGHMAYSETPSVAGGGFRLAVAVNRRRR